MFRRRPISISVRRVDRQREATVAMREALTARPGLTVIQIVTSTGAVLDWLLHPDFVQWADEQVSPR
jgi:hypothetical protein